MPEAYRGDLDPDEQRGDEQVVGHTRQEQQQHRKYSCGEGIAGVVLPEGLRFEPTPQQE